MIADPNEARDWVVFSYVDHGPGAYYRFSIVDGFNHSTGQRISWSVRDFDDARYNLDGATEVSK